MGEVDETLAGIVIGILFAIFSVLGIGLTAARHRPATRERPEDPTRPDVSHLDRAEVVADHEAKQVAEAVEQALAGEAGADNPHGLARVVNDRRER